MNEEPERQGDEIGRLRAEVADLRSRIELVEGEPAPSGDDCRCSPVLDAPTAFTLGALVMMMVMLPTIIVLT
ncbi:MAG: hypothetical protein OXI50_16905 [Gammaproteobacteria bacterium]|nr:hypothetical protein [Gammaproteobacteria bacterium]